MTELEILMTDETALNLLRICAKGDKTPSQVVSEIIRKAASDAGVDISK